MNLQSGIGSHRIGEWHFHPGSGELRRGSDVRRLEPRAARTLELLLEARGSVVSHERLIHEVWSGRTLSENSVAVVVGQLRRALGDDARDPKLIETIPKRGYRLVVEASPVTAARRRYLLLALVLAVLVVGTVVGLRAMLAAGPDIAMADIPNQTGEARYDPLARATTELMLAELSKRGYEVDRGGDGPLKISGKLVMWSGEPYLGLSATDSRGVVRWSAMIRGTPDAVPAGLHAALDDFQKKVPR
ncbi:MAG TPA: transcriptional regulator [Sphingomicrobium sp.]|jgi:DNA-binding winged helix-turn-helix (wHTH) protein|nr:transcriptional regulator [Sphingomicrobium sp.]